MKMRQRCQKARRPIDKEKRLGSKVTKRQGKKARRKGGEEMKRGGKEMRSRGGDEAAVRKARVKGVDLPLGNRFFTLHFHQ